MWSLALPQTATRGAQYNKVTIPLPFSHQQLLMLLLLLLLLLLRAINTRKMESVHLLCTTLHTVYSVLGVFQHVVAFGNVRLGNNNNGTPPRTSRRRPIRTARCCRHPPGRRRRRRGKR